MSVMSLCMHRVWICMFVFSFSEMPVVVVRLVSSDLKHGCFEPKPQWRCHMSNVRQQT